MADIFISYSREDKVRIEALARAIEQEGFSVWWDNRLAPGARFSKETEARLTEAKIVIVAWSRASIDSMWVADEASVGRDNANLVPIAIDPVEPPIGFRQIQTMAFQSWDGETSSQPFSSLADVIRERITGAAAPRSPPTAPRKKIAWRAAPIGIAAAAILLGAALFFLVARDGRSGDISGAAPLAEFDSASVAVLPFADLSASGDQSYFSSGVAEEIISRLIRVSGVSVIGRSSSFASTAEGKSAAEVGKALGAAHILEGSVRSSGDRLRVSVRLIRASDGLNLWTETFDRTLTDIFAVQDDIAAAVVEALQGRVLGPSAAPLTAADPASYRRYLRGRTALGLRTADGIAEAISEFEAVVAAAPEFAPAYAALTKAYAIQFFFDQTLNPAQIGDKGRRAAERALELDPANAEALAAHGAIELFNAWRFDRARELLEAAIAAAPDNPDALNFYGDYLIYAGDFDAAVEIKRRHAAIDPLLPTAWSDYAQALWFKGDRQAAFAANERSVAVGGETYSAGAFNVVRLHLMAGDPASARAALAKVQDRLTARQNQTIEAWLAIIEGDARALETALQEIEENVESGEESAASLAMLHARAGDDAEAAKYIELAYRRREPVLISPYYFLLPEDWPDLPLVRAALDKPELATLFALRRRNGAQAATDRR